MKTFVRALLATAVSIGIFFVYAAFIKHRVATYYLNCGCEIPDRDLVQLDVSSFIYRLWWLIAIPVMGFWAVLFAIIAGVHARRDTAATASLT